VKSNVRTGPEEGETVLEEASINGTPVSN